MKKIIALIIAATAVLTLSACREEPDFVDEVTKYYPNETSVFSDTQTEAPAIDQPDEPTAVMPSFTVSAFTEETDHCRADVKYPTVSGISNAEAVNSVIYSATREFVMNDISYTFVSETVGTYEIESVETAYADGMLLSFVYNGSFYAEGAAHPIGFIRTLNIDVENAALLDTSEIFSDFHKLCKYFEDGLFVQVSSGNAELDAEREAVKRSDLIGQYRAEYGLYPNVYFITAESGIGITVSAETVYALGDHIEFTANTADISDCLSEQILELTKGSK